MATRATTIKVADLAKAVDKAVANNTGTKTRNPIIMGIILRELGNINANAAAKNITKEVSKALPGIALSPKVVVDGGITTIGFILRSAQFQ